MHLRIVVLTLASLGISVWGVLHLPVTAVHAVVTGLALGAAALLALLRASAGLALRASAGLALGTAARLTDWGTA